MNIGTHVYMIAFLQRGFDIEWCFVGLGGGMFVNFQFQFGNSS
jgi:hypothetical protein